MSNEKTSLSATLDAIHAKSRGVEQHDGGLTPEQLDEQRRAAEDAAMERAEHRPERRAAAERVARILRSLTNHVGTLKHGAVYTQANKKAAVAAIVDELGGGVSTATRDAIRSFVTEAATSVRSGDKTTPTRRAYDVAEKIAATGDELAGPTAPTVDADDETDPAKLAAMVPRS